MRSKVTFILLALNLILFGYLVLSERPWATTQTIDANRRRVLGPEAAALSAIEITAYDPAPAATTTAGTVPAAPAPAAAPTRSVRLQRDAKSDAWFLTTPLDWPANDFAVRRILGELQFLEHETSFPVSDLQANGQTLADFGLASPRLVIICTPAAPKSSDTPAPAPFILRIGDGTAVGNRLYVLSPDGRRIHVVARSLLDALSLDLAQLRSDQLFTIPVFEARALTLQNGANSARTRLRHDQHRWIFESPINARAAKTPVELAINDLNALQVARFLPADSAPSPEVTGLAAPRLRLTLEGNARRETLHLGLPVSTTTPTAADAAIEYYARLDDRPTAFTVAIPASLHKTLDGAQTVLRDRRVLDFDPAHATAVVLASPLLPELRIQKLDTTTAGTAAEWQLASTSLPVPLRADTALVARLLRNLRLLEAVPPAPTSARPDPSPFFSDAPSGAELENLGFNRPERTITLRLDPPATPGAPVTGPATLVLELALPGGTDPGVYARIVGQPFIYTLPPDALDLFPVVPRSWRDRTLARLPEATRITRLVLRKTSADSAAPLLDYTPSSTPPPPAIATLLAAIRDLRAGQIVREGYPATVPVDGAEKPWAYMLEATTEPATDGPVVLTLAERTGGMTQLAGSEKLNLVFTLDQPVLDALWTLLYPEPAK